MSFTPPPGPGPYPDGPNNPGPYGQPGQPGPSGDGPPPYPGAPAPLPGDAAPPTSGAGLPPLPGDSQPYQGPGGYPGQPGGYPDQSQPWQFDPATSAPPVSGPPPGYDPTGMPVSGPPPYDQTGMYGDPRYGQQPGGPGMPPPPPPRKSNTGMIIGIVAGVVGLLLVLGIGGIALLVHSHNTAKERAAEIESSASAGASGSPYESESDSPTPSASPTSRDPSTLDSKSTDETPFEMSQFFPNTIGSYSLAADGSFSGCTDSGASATQSLMKKHGCDDMGTASYLNSDNSLMVSALMIPLSASSDADAVVADFKQGGESFTGLRYFCPKSGTGASICDSGNDPRWYAWYIAFHRYVIVATVLRTDGKDTDGSSSTAKSFATDVLYGIEDQTLTLD